MVSDTTDGRAKKKRPAPPHAFKPGQSGNPKGRPKGSRNKLSEDFISAIAAEFEKHGEVALATVREEQPAKFLQMVADLVPKDMQLTHNAGDAFVALWQSLASKTDEA